MTSPETPTPDEQEQRLSPTGDLPVDRAPEVPLEADAADALEQARDDAPTEHRTEPDPLPLETDPADAAEQAAVVHLDEDEGRD